MLYPLPGLYILPAYEHFLCIYFLPISHKYIEISTWLQVTVSQGEVLFISAIKKGCAYLPALLIKEE